MSDLFEFEENPLPRMLCDLMEGLLQGAVRASDLVLKEVSYSLPGRVGANSNGVEMDCQFIEIREDLEGIHEFRMRLRTPDWTAECRAETDKALYGDENHVWCMVKSVASPAMDSDDWFCTALVVTFETAWGDLHRMKRDLMLLRLGGFID